MSRVVLDKAAVRFFGQREAGKAVSKVARETLLGSKRMARRSPAHLSGSRVPKPGPRLTEAIHLTPMKFSVLTVQQQVMSPVEYSMTEHEGSRRHRIRSRSGKALKFYWRKRQRSQRGFRRFRPTQASYFDHVWHPGNRRPVKFLTTPLAVSARGNNFVFNRSNF